MCRRLSSEVVYSAVCLRGSIYSSSASSHTGGLSLTLDGSGLLTFLISDLGSTGGCSLLLVSCGNNLSGDTERLDEEVDSVVGHGVVGPLPVENEMKYQAAIIVKETACSCTALIGMSTSQWCPLLSRAAMRPLAMDNSFLLMIAQISSA